MSHTITQYDGVVTVRLDSRPNAQELSQGLNVYLETKTGGTVIILIDLTFVTAIGQQVKAALYRALQHHNILKVGFFGATPDVAAELTDMLPVLVRLHPVALQHTELDVRQKLGLVKVETAYKLGGMLNYLRKSS